MAKKPAQRGSVEGAAVVLTKGEERFLHLEAGDKARKHFAAVNGDPAVFTFDGTSATPAEVLDELRSMGLMASSKVVIIENFELFLREKDEEEEGSAAAGPKRGIVGRTPREVMTDYVAAPEPGTLLLLRTGPGRWTPGKFEDAVESGGGAVIDCGPLDPAQAAARCVQMAQAHGTTIQPQAAQAIVAAVGVGLTRLESEIEKLAVAAVAWGEAAITTQTVATLIGSSRDDDELYHIQPYLLRADPQAALAKLRNMVEVSRISPVIICLPIADLLRKVEGASRGLAARENPRDVSARLKLWGSTSDMIMAAGARVKPRQAAALLALCVETDARCKMTGYNAEVGVESLVLRCCTALSQRA